MEEDKIGQTLGEDAIDRAVKIMEKYGLSRTAEHVFQFADLIVRSQWYSPAQGSLKK